MKILIAPNSFKGSLPAILVGKAIEKGIKKVDRRIKTELLPISDGGDGFISSLVFAKFAKLKTAVVSDPLGRRISANFAYIPDKRIALIEMALASGLALLNDDEKNPMKASSRGSGELIIHAIRAGAKKIILGIGGTATCDAGIGALSAMGVKFFDKNNVEVAPIPENLCEIRKIDLSDIKTEIFNTTIEIACDVKNPLIGKNGAARIYAPQKGATAFQVEKLESGLANFAKVLKNTTGVDITKMNGGGAAGGIGATLHAILNAKMRKGTDIIFSLLELKKRINGADLVITGEGRIDLQTAFGKAPIEIAKFAKKNAIPCIALCGSVGEEIELLHREGISAIFPICRGPISLDEAMKNAKKLLSATAEEAVRAFRAGILCASKKRGGRGERVPPFFADFLKKL
jgi:glycerate kinase